MCGLVGFLQPSAVEREQQGHRHLRAMADAIVHRGPDGDGFWADASAGIFLGHRRLAILDLSPAGMQPMASPSGRYVLAFNGEVYNHGDLRARMERDGALRGPWRGHSDTETMAAGFDLWGVESTLRELVGMFAIAVWDRTERVLTLVRDRLGEKPLYFGWQGQGQGRALLFGSELSALRRHPAFSGSVSRSALTGYLRFGYVGGESSIFEGIAKVGPGQLVRVTPDDGRCVTHEWWSASAVVTRGVRQAFQGSPTEAVDELDRVLREAVRGQMVADVAVGAFLSGGIDSSLVVALMQQESATPVRTYSIGFHEKAYNEARHAKAVAAHLGTQHTELYVSPQDAMAVIPRLPELYSEPFADSSQIPTYLVSRLARGSVTVALSGDAGDELFAGYNRYRAAAQLWGRVSGLPEGIKRAIAGVLRAIPPSAFGALDRLLPFVQLADKAPKAAAMLESATLDDMYRTVTSQWFDPKSVVVGGTEPPEPDVGEFVGDGVSGVERMMLRDLVSYLPGDILAKVDRAAMGVSLETRVPFLDHRVVEFAWSLPLEYKLRGGTTKWPLRSLLDRYVPRALVDRPKMGFAVPVDRWLRGPLRQWADGLLDESRIRSEGFFEPLAIQRAWQEHLSGARNRQAQLWGVLMFQAWKERYGV